MKKDMKKRLERALLALQEPGGSTIRSIVKVINKESPVLSLRKVLEALQEGINEGFLCMYNGRFKLKQQIQHQLHKNNNKLVYGLNDQVLKSDDNLKRCEADLYDEEKSINSSVDDKLDFVEKDHRVNVSKLQKLKSRELSLNKPRRGKKVRMTKKSYSECPKKKGGIKRCINKEGKHCDKSKSKQPMKKNRKLAKDFNNNVNCHSVLNMSDSYGDNKTTSSRHGTDKIDIKKQRGPRCTSMKKEIRMPSKVQIPFMPPSVPQRGNNFNEFLRRSPEPVNGPLFDSYNSFSFKPDKLEFFGAYC